MPSRVSPQDPVAVVIASTVAILGALGLLTRWGLTADDVAQIGGAALALAAALRAILDSRKRQSSATTTTTTTTTVPIPDPVAAPPSAEPTERDSA